MRVLVVDTYYAAFLNAFYAQHRDLPLRPYAEQHRVLMEQCFGTADFYSANLSRIGQEAIEVVSNCEQLQRQWAVEHGVKLKESGWNKVRGLVSWAPRTGSIDWFHTVLTAQVKQCSPDVLYIQDMNSLNPGFLREVKQYARLIVGQIACPISPGADFSEYDLILSSLPLLVEGFRRDGLASEYFKLGFEPRVLERLSESKRSGVAFVGSLSPNHAERIGLLQKIARSVPLDVWGSGIEGLQRDSPLRTGYHGEAWALDMYQVLRNTCVAVNHHIDMAGSYANNMRLFEATGVGTLLVTDVKVNLTELFAPGREVVVYSTPQECVELIEYYLLHADEREAIAEAGQQRTLSEHTYYHRMQELVEIIKRRLSSSSQVGNASYGSRDSARSTKSSGATGLEEHREIDAQRYHKGN